MSTEEERELLEHVRATAWSEVRMHGVIAKRRVAHYGWLYGYESWKVEQGPEIPAHLLQVRDRLAMWSGVDAGELGEALVTEYQPSAGIGWHRDAPMFGIVAAVSLEGACRMQFRPHKEPDSDRREIEVAPRSAYLIAGASRFDWQHHIPPTKELRYSITFRTLRKRA